MALNTALIIGAIVAVIATVLAYLFIMPERYRDTLPGFFQWVHDVFNFKSLLIEKIMKALYVFCTIGVIVVGILLLFGSNFLWGVVCIILGPLVVRIIYEVFMLFILLVQNVIAINRKMQ